MILHYLKLIFHPFAFFLILGSSIFAENSNDLENQISSLVNLIRQAPIEKLRDAAYLEHELLLTLGLNGEILHEFPEELYPFCGKGLKSWQYPSQFSKFLVYLSGKQIQSYLEIGTRHGGTFIIITEYLKRFNPTLKSLGLDPFYSPIMATYVEKVNPSASYCLDTSTSQPGQNLIRSNSWDLCFIDGDHSYEGVSFDYNLVKDRAKVLVFHDMVSDACLGVVQFWEKLKSEYPPSSVHSFTDQYQSVLQRTNLRYLGIGIIETDPQ